MLVSPDADAAAARAATRARILAHLSSHNVMTLATSAVWAAAVFYVNDGLTLYFLSSPTSRHCRDLALDARIAATIQRDYEDWRLIRGIQLEGIVRAVAADDEQRVRRLYGQKFPFVIAGADPAIDKALSKIRWYEVRPRDIYLVDNSVRFGYREFLDMGVDPN